MKKLVNSYLLYACVLPWSKAVLEADQNCDHKSVSSFMWLEEILEINDG